MKIKLKNLIYEIKIKFENLYFYVFRFIRDIPWHIRKAKYRRKLWKKLKQYYQADWDIVDSIQEFIFILFLEFYENNRDNLNKISFGFGKNDEKQDKMIKLQIDSVYKFLTEYRPNVKETLKRLWNEHHYKYPMIWEDDEDHKGYSKLKFGGNKKQSKKELDIIVKMEDGLHNDEVKVLQEIIDLKDNLWY